MIYQLPNGRIIEMSLEQYLELDEQDIRELNGLGKEYTSEAPNPFYKSSIKNPGRKADEPEVWEFNEREPSLDEIKDIEKMDDKYFHRDDN
tara:strand:+ start:2014 stop:2286 length:273 start_codon:yes stop_codon:yes gene_type:complete